MPKVAFIIGSDSDLKYIKEGLEILKKFEISYELKILSAHRSPNLLSEYLNKINKSETEVIIAAAGGAAHLPGVIAAHTTLPVIGLPIKSKTMDGLDSLLSIVQMPSGVPVATVGINNAKNAALLTLQILSLKYPHLKNKLKDYKEKMEKEIEEKNK